jgi:hypothetical protein
MSRMKLPLQRVVGSLRRMLSLCCLGTILLVLTAVWKRYSVEGDLERVANACVVLAVLSFVALAVAWWQRRARGAPEDPGLLVTAFLAVLSLTYVSLLRLVPSSFDVRPDWDRRLWEYLDRRWIWALYLSALALVYAPGLARWVIARFAAGDAEHRPPQMATSSAPYGVLRSRPARLAAAGGIGLLCVLLLAAPQIRVLLAIELYLLCALLAYLPVRLRSALSFDRLIAAYAIGFALAVIFIAPGASTILRLPVDSHEMGHLGSLQAISQGATPFVQARTQYGPGHQFITYFLMRHVGFTIAGFRLSHLIFNIFGAAMLFGTAFFAFGWSVGALVTIVALYLSPFLFWTWSGWGLIFRWIPPLLVGAILPLTLQQDDAWVRRRAAIVMLGAACGLLLWFSQDTLASTILAAVLILTGSASRGNMTLAAAISAFATFALSAASVFILVVTQTVGSQNLGLFFADYFRGSMLLEGMQNQAWYEPFRPWGIVFYLTPFVLLLMTIVALYSRRDAVTATEERTRAQVLGMAAAASSLVPLTLLRSGTGNLIASSTALPAALVLSLIYLPALITRTAYLRELTRVLLVTAFLVIYPLPSGVADIVRDYVPTPDRVLRGITRTLTVPAIPVNASLLERRLGFTPNSQDRCCTGAADLTYGELSSFVTALHEATDGRTVYVDYTVLMPSSALYFLADLKVGTSMPEPTMFLWFKSDLDAFRRQLRAAPPDCTLTSPVFLEGGTANDLLSVYGRYTQVALGGRLRQASGERLFPILVFCRDKAAGD